MYWLNIFKNPLENQTIFYLHKYVLFWTSHFPAEMEFRARFEI